MRYAFGLVALLVSIAILMKLFADNAQVVTKAGGKAQQDARQYAGRDQNTGEAATDALTLDLAQRGGKTIGMTVKSVKPGSSIERYYGLQANDVILDAGAAPLSEPFVSDVATGSSFILKAYQEKREITVQRGAQRLILPPPDGAPIPPPAAPTNSAAADPLAAPAPAPAPPPNPPAPKGGLDRQLDLIRGQGAGQ